MSTKTGIWIDKKQAYVVTLTNDNEHIDIIESNADFRVRFEGETSSASKFGKQSVNHEKEKEIHLEKQLKDYYKKITKKVSDAEKIYVFGPAEAKKELRKQLSESLNMASKTITLETSDKLTKNQIVAAVKKHFGV